MRCSVDRGTPSEVQSLYEFDTQVAIASSPQSKLEGIMQNPRRATGADCSAELSTRCEAQRPQRTTLKLARTQHLDFDVGEAKTIN